MNSRIAPASRASRLRFSLLVLPVVAVMLVAAVGAGQRGAEAEGAPQFTKMSVAVMPEYDQRSVLVSYRGIFGPEVSLPVQTAVRVPADAEIEQVCSITPEEEHLCQPYTADPDGQYLAVAWEAVTPVLYVEFYYGSVSGAGQRDLDFTLMPPYPVEELEMFVLEPSDATGFTLSPEAADIVEEQGFRHHMYTFQNVPADEPLSIAINYSRDTDEPAAPPRAASAAAGGRGGISQTLVLSLGLAGAAVLALVVFSAFRRRFRVTAAAPAPPAPEGTDMASQGDTLFCRQCGTRVRPGSMFCFECGQEARPPLRGEGL